MATYKPLPRVQIDPDNLDEDSKNLVDAIGWKESSNGTNKESELSRKEGSIGFYQYIPDTWKRASNELLGGVDLDGNPLDINDDSHQRLVTYAYVKARKDQGYLPKDILRSHPQGIDAIDSTPTPGSARYADDGYKIYQQLKTKKLVDKHLSYENQYYQGDYNNITNNTSQNQEKTFDALNPSSYNKNDNIEQKTELKSEGQNKNEEEPERGAGHSILEAVVGTAGSIIGGIAGGVFGGGVGAVPGSVAGSTLALLALEGITQLFEKNKGKRKEFSGKGFAKAGAEGVIGGLVPELKLAKSVGSLSVKGLEKLGQGTVKILGKNSTKLLGRGTGRFVEGAGQSVAQQYTDDTIEGKDKKFKNYILPAVGGGLTNVGISSIPTLLGKTKLKDKLNPYNLLAKEQQEGAYKIFNFKGLSGYDKFSNENRKFKLPDNQEKIKLLQDSGVIPPTLSGKTSNGGSINMAQIIKNLEDGIGEYDGKMNDLSVMLDIANGEKIKENSIPIFDIQSSEKKIKDVASNVVKLKNKYNDSDSKSIKTVLNELIKDITQKPSEDFQTFNNRYKNYYNSLKSKKFEDLSPGEKELTKILNSEFLNERDNIYDKFGKSIKGIENYSEQVRYINDVSKTLYDAKYGLKEYLNDNGVDKAIFDQLSDIKDAPNIQSSILKLLSNKDAVSLAKRLPNTPKSERITEFEKDIKSNPELISKYKEKPSEKDFYAEDLQKKQLKNEEKLKFEKEKTDIKVAGKKELIQFKNEKEKETALKINEEQIKKIKKQIENEKEKTKRDSLKKEITKLQLQKEQIKSKSIKDKLTDTKLKTEVKKQENKINEKKIDLKEKQLKQTQTKQTPKPKNNTTQKTTEKSKENKAKGKALDKAINDTKDKDYVKKYRLEESDYLNNKQYRIVSIGENNEVLVRKVGDVDNKNVKKGFINEYGNVEFN